MGFAVEEDIVLNQSEKEFIPSKEDVYEAPLEITASEAMDQMKKGVEEAKEAMKEIEEDYEKTMNVDTNVLIAGVSFLAGSIIFGLIGWKAGVGMTALKSRGGILELLKKNVGIGTNLD
jgi:hypothetical protein